MLLHPAQNTNQCLSCCLKGNLIMLQWHTFQM